jgi:DNA-binding MarR family transcriptional regulator
MAKRDELLLLGNQLCFPLYAVSRLATQLYNPLLNELDITYPQYLVLLVLWENDNQLVSDVCNTLYLESNTVTPLLKRMEQKGLIKRQRQKGDERQVAVLLTPKAKALKEKAYCIPGRLIETLKADNISEKQFIELRTTLYKMLDMLKQQTEQA